MMALMCMQCKTETCSDCSIKSHQGHALQRMHEELYAMKKNIPNLLREKSKLEVTLECNLKESLQWETNLKKFEVSCDKDIRTAVQQLIDYLGDLLKKSRLFWEISPELRNLEELVKNRTKALENEVVKLESLSKELERAKQYLEEKLFVENSDFALRYGQIRQKCSEYEEQARKEQEEQTRVRGEWEKDESDVRNMGLDEIMNNFLATIVTRRISTLQRRKPFLQPDLIERKSSSGGQSSS